MSGHPQRQTLHLPDDPRIHFPDSGMRVECRRYKAASQDKLHKDDLNSVRTSLEAATAAQLYHQGQIMQLSYAVAQLQDQLNKVTAQQSHDEAAHPSTGTSPHIPTTTYRPPGPTSVSRVPASSQEQRAEESYRESVSRHRG